MNSIPLSKAVGLRIVCTCGAQAMVPIPAKSAPTACFNCGQQWPDASVKEMARLIHWINTERGRDAVQVELALVGE